MNETIRCLVGDHERVIDADIFIDAFKQLSAFYISLGLEGDMLDVHIAKELPHRLAHMIDGTQ